MLTKVKAYSSWRSAPLLGLSEYGPQTDPIQVRNIEGLGPVKSTVNTESYGSIDGEAYTGTEVPARNIVITLGLNPDWKTWTMESIRRILYTYFMPKQPVVLVFESDDEIPPVKISGITESAEPEMFVKDGEIQVSIVCPDPYFYALDPIVVPGVTAEGVEPIEIEYLGSVETGVTVKVSYTENPFPNNIGIQIGDPSETFFRVWTDITLTKYFVMSSIPGNKYAQTVELGSGIIKNLLYRVEDGSTWPTLQPGMNDFQVITNGGEQDWELSYIPKFGGL